MIWLKRGARPGCVLNHFGPLSVPAGQDYTLERPPDIGTLLLAEFMVCFSHNAPKHRAAPVAELSLNTFKLSKIYIFST
jgi:hypothetical protein